MRPEQPLVVVIFSADDRVDSAAVGILVSIITGQSISRNYRSQGIGLVPDYSKKSLVVGYLCLIGGQFWWIAGARAVLHCSFSDAYLFLTRANKSQAIGSVPGRDGLIWHIEAGACGSCVARPPKILVGKREVFCHLSIMYSTDEISRWFSCMDRSVTTLSFSIFGMVENVLPDTSYVLFCKRWEKFIWNGTSHQPE